MRVVEPRHRFRLGPPREDHRIERVHVLLSPSIPRGVDEVGLAPDPHGGTIFVAAKADEVEGGLYQQKLLYERRKGMFETRIIECGSGISPACIARNSA